MTTPLLPPVGPSARPAASLYELPRAECLTLLTAHMVGRAAVTGARGLPPLRARAYTRQHGEDPPEVRDWTWPGQVA